MNAIHHTTLRSLFLTLSAVLALNAAAAQPPAEGKIRVLLTYGGHEFEEKPFFAMFDALPGIAYTKAEMPKEAGMFKPGLEKQFDVIVMYDAATPFTPEQQKDFVALLNTGIGVFSLHHNLCQKHGWDEFHQIIGGMFSGGQHTIDGRTFGPSGCAHDQDIKAAVADKQHPVTAGIDDFQIRDEVYNNCYTAPGVKLLLTTDHPQSDRPLAWVKEYGKSRIVYLQLGHDSTAWRNPNFTRILDNGIRWLAADRSPKQ